MDEALFAIFSDPTPNILSFFQQDAERHAEFRVRSTCGFRYQATTRRVVEEYLQERERLVREEAESLMLSDLPDLQSQNEWRQLYAVPMNQAPASLGRPTVVTAPSEKPFSDEMDSDGLGSGRKRLGGVLLYNNRNGAADWAEFAKQPQGGSFSFDSRGALFADGITISGFALAGERFSGAAPRRELPAAGWWTGAVTTNADGKVNVEIPLPESASQWRLTARGVSVETLVGQGTGKIMTRKEFFATLKTPRTLQEGDTVKLIARVHNLTDYAGPVEMKLTVKGGPKLASRLAERSLTVPIEKQGVAEAVFENGRYPFGCRTAICRGSICR